MTLEALWTDVDEYFEATLLPDDAILDEALRSSAAAGLPPHDVSPAQGRLLQILALLRGARTILEIGTLGGTSAIWLGRALPRKGRLVSLERDPHYAGVARANLERAGLAGAVEIRVGDALDSLRELVAQSHPAFDMIFIDADKANNPAYLEWALRLSRPGTLILADNVVREGEVANATSTDPRVLGVRRFAELLGSDPRLTATAVQTVGRKGFDGFAIALVESVSASSD